MFSIPNGIGQTELFMHQSVGFFLFDEGLCNVIALLYSNVYVSAMTLNNIHGVIVLLIKTCHDYYSQSVFRYIL